MDLTLAIPLFFVATVVIAIAGTRLARVADQLADLTGLGEAMLGAVFLGGVTSLPGIITSVVAAYQDHPELAVSNAIGGIAAQTVFLSVADIAYRDVNLEHAAASFANLMQGVLLIALLSMVLIGTTGPELTFLGIHPLSLLLFAAYLAGSRLIAKAKDRPMWRPRQTRDTVSDIPDEENIQQLSLKRLLLQALVLGVLVGAAGYAVAESGILIADRTGLSESFVGALLTAVATSLPELIVSVAAVRQRALTLAVGNIIGGNAFDLLFIAFADVAYRPGSIFHALTDSQIFIVALTMLMVSVLILGLLHRQKRGIGRIGWESFLIIVLYVLGNALLFHSG